VNPFQPWFGFPVPKTKIPLERWIGRPVGKPPIKTVFRTNSRPPPDGGNRVNQQRFAVFFSGPPKSSPKPPPPGPPPRQIPASRAPPGSFTVWPNPQTTRVLLAQLPARKRDQPWNFWLQPGFVRGSGMDAPENGFPLWPGRNIGFSPARRPPVATGVNPQHWGGGAHHPEKSPCPTRPPPVPRFNPLWKSRRFLAAPPTPPPTPQWGEAG